MTPAFPLNPEKAWFSGYRIPYETFCQWVVTLPQPASAPPHEPGNHRRLYYFSFWLDWTNTLPIDSKWMVPRIRFETDADEETTLTVFFPLRWVDFTSKYQVVPGASKYNPRICQEKESDKAKLETFMQLLNQQNTPLDRDKIQFGWQKEVHPRDEWRSF